MGLCMAAQKGPFVMKYYVVLSPTAPEHPSVLPRGKGTESERKRVERKNIRNKRNTVICCVDSGERWGNLGVGLKPNAVFLSLLTRCVL